MNKVLWIEDNAMADLQELLAPVYVDGTYELTLAENASDAIKQLWKSEFVAVIVDIRIPPGQDKNWQELYRTRGNSNKAARLGLEVIRTALQQEASITRASPPVWLSPTRFAVFTVESGAEVEQDVRKLGVKVYRQKRVATPPTVLLDLIARIKEQTEIARIKPQTE
jgi:DNA-binding NarL/FixJ family response regulator